MEIKNKGGQIAVFVIIALVLVVSIASVFMLVQQPLTKTKALEDPRAAISECVEEIGEEALELIGTYGGYIDSQDLNILYEDEKRTYLCHTSEEKELCTNQEPLLVNNIKQEITDYVAPKIETCFSDLEKILIDYNPELGTTNLEVEIVPNSLLIKIDKRIVFTRHEQTQTYEIFDSSIPSPMFDFAKLTVEIINQELDCQCGLESCNADVVEIATKNRNFDIEKFLTGDDEEIYKLREFNSGKEFIFAIRNCVRFS